MAEVKLPTLAEGVDKASISFWHVQVGGSVEEGEDLVELVTDKAAFNMPSPVSGTIKKICAEEGAEVNVGSVIAEIE
ncbi:MAG: lipoyl domain-containing protein [Candidatus Omnitrophota bacterium]